MRTFLTVWVGQFISTIGSYMTVFAFTLWVWQLTSSATALAFISFSAQIPRIGMTLFAGLITDRFNRQHLMILGDTSAVLCTTIVGFLYWSDRLEVWHLCAVMALHGCFSQIQNLAYAASITLMVPKQDYARASSLRSAVGYGAAILSPALAGNLYPRIGLGGIILLDILTFTAAFGTLLTVTIPQPSLQASPDADASSAPPQTIAETIKTLTFGFRYIAANPYLTGLVIAFTLFALPNEISRVLYNPMILARTDGNAQTLGLVTTIAGLGGITGAIAISIGGGFKRRIHGMLLGFMGTGVSKLILGIGQSLVIWLPAQFLATFHTPLLFSSSNAIWYAKVPANIQGQVLAADDLIGLVVAAIATLIAGPLADQIFEPAMQTGGWLAPIFGPLVGRGPGAGLALIYSITALWMILVGLWGYQVKDLREVERLLPDPE